MDQISSTTPPRKTLSLTHLLFREIKKIAAKSILNVTETHSILSADDHGTDSFNRHFRHR